jgi:hypothetical protein
MSEKDKEEVIWSETNDENADWIKSLSWDLPTDVDGFLSALGSMSVEHFMTLPASKAMPEELAGELMKYGHLKPQGL